MFRLSQKADYGLILLSTLSRTQGRTLSIGKIATKHKISPKFLSQIAQELKKAGFLKAKEGVSGGYLLAKDPVDIRLLDVLKVLEGDLVAGKCFEEDHECICGAKDVWVEMKEHMQMALDNKTIADLANAT